MKLPSPHRRGNGGAGISRFAPTVIRNVRYVRAFAASASLGSVSAIAHLLLIDPLVWVVFRSATGFALSIMFVVPRAG